MVYMINFFTACIQWPLQTAQQSHAPLLVINVEEAFCNLDPLLYAWLLVSPGTVSVGVNTNSATSGTDVTTQR